MQTIVLLHDSADSVASWNPVRRHLADRGHEVFAPDLLGYGNSSQASCCYKVGKEVQHLDRSIAAQGLEDIHLVGHGYGAFVALHLRQALAPRVKSLTLVSPLSVGILRESGDKEAYAEMDQLYRRFMSLSTHNETAAAFFIDHWRGQGAWTAMGAGERNRIAALIPKVRREMVALHADRARLSWLAGAWLPAAVVIGESVCRPVRAAAWRVADAFHMDPVTVAGAGHRIPDSHPAEIAEIIARLATVKPARRRVAQAWAEPQAAVA